MNTLIVVVAQYLLYGLVVVAGVLWVTRSRRDKAVLTGEAIVGLILVGIGIWLASALHSDPRPFVHDPASKPLFLHPADNGFPSDHSAAGALLAALTFRYKRWLGVIVGVAAVAVGTARVAAHVHHGQDIVAGLAIGVIAGALAIWLIGLLTAELRRRGVALGAVARTTADRAQTRGH